MSKGRARWAFCIFITAISVFPAAAQVKNLPAEVDASIVEMGPALSPGMISKSIALMRPLQASRADMTADTDIAYGPDPL